MTPRVLILTPYFYPLIGGVESNAERLADYLQATGISAQILTKRISPSLPDEDTRLGVPIHRIGPYGDRSALGKWRMIPATIAWLIQHRSTYDVVCVVDYRGVGIAAILARTVTGIPVLIQGQTTGILSGVVAGSDAPREPVLTRLTKWPLRQTYVRADGIACISRVLQEEALAYGVPAARVHLLPNGIDMRRFTPAADDDRRARRAALGLGDHHVVCVFVGRLSHEKGIMELLDAWHLAHAANAVLLVAGPDMPGSEWDRGPAARALVAKSDMPASVRFLGPTDNVAGLLQLADLAIQPSHFEALGLSAIEAMACGVPVIASRVGGLPDFVIDGVNGRLVPVRDVSALAAALAEFITESSLRRRAAAAARASVAEYDTGVVFARMTDVLTTLAERRNH